MYSPTGALPARFRRPRLLVVGCGDVGVRLVNALSHQPGKPRLRVFALTSSAQRIASLRALGVTPLLANLDQPASLLRLAGLATHVVHLAPPEREGVRDLRTRALVRALRLRTRPQALVYVSTSGVYGDCQGALVAETKAVAPATPRAVRRVDAEHSVRQLGRAGTRASMLRVPGIYASDRVGGTPEARLRRGTPVLAVGDDVFTNHIHADDLARACVIALWHGAPQRVYNISDQSDLRMGDYFDKAADLYGLPRPPRVRRSEAAQHLGEMQLSFMSESRRLDATRMERELGLCLRYPTVLQGLREMTKTQRS